MYEHANQYVLKRGEVVRHRCDNGFCCNPEHLLLGTQKDNSLDKTLRNRTGVQRITVEDAKDILIRRRQGESSRVLAAEYGLSIVGVEHIGRRSFKFLMKDQEVLAYGDGVRSGRKLTRDMVQEIKRQIANGDDHALIAINFKVTKAYITDIANGRRWSSVD
jgi:hypothetical protein